MRKLSQRATVKTFLRRNSSNLSSSVTTTTRRSQWISRCQMAPQHPAGRGRSKCTSSLIIQTLSCQRERDSFSCPPVSRHPAQRETRTERLTFCRCSKIWPLPDPQLRVYARHPCPYSVRLSDQRHLPPHNPRRIPHGKRTIFRNNPQSAICTKSNTAAL
jgi:hypothetical protein